MLYNGRELVHADTADTTPDTLESAAQAHFCRVVAVLVSAGLARVPKSQAIGTSFIANGRRA